MTKTGRCALLRSIPERESLMSLYTSCLRPLLFRLDAEVAHHATVEACHYAGQVPGLATAMRAVLEYRAPELETEVVGLRLANPLGLAAGWDKSARALRMIGALGFGFAEIGSVSARASRGNPKPRLFRLRGDEAIIVNYGLPNDGSEIVAERLARCQVPWPLGVNLVKTNDGPEAPECSEDEIMADYAQSLGRLHRHAGYVALNLSCPNAKGGKDFFAQPGTIGRLVERVTAMDVQCPVFLKVAPQVDPAALERLIAEADPFPVVRGFIFNLPSGRPEALQFRTPRESFAHWPGAVAGPPVARMIDTSIRELYRRMPAGRFAIIGAGGVFTAQDAYAKIRLGASLVQIYTALIYEGPAVVGRILRGLAELLRRDGFQHVGEAVGTGLGN